MEQVVKMGIEMLVKRLLCLWTILDRGSPTWVKDVLPRTSFHDGGQLFQLSLDLLRSSTACLSPGSRVVGRWDQSEHLVGPDPLVSAKRIHRV